MWVLAHEPLLLLLNCFSCVQLCSTPQRAAHQAPPSLGFSRQEHWRQQKPPGRLPHPHSRAVLDSSHCTSPMERAQIKFMPTQRDKLPEDLGKSQVFFMILLIIYILHSQISNDVLHKIYKLMTVLFHSFWKKKKVHHLHQWHQGRVWLFLGSLSLLT